MQIKVFLEQNPQTDGILFPMYGGVLHIKRLEKHSFKWPTSQSEIVVIGKRELSWLMDGLSIHQVEAHKTLKFSVLY